MLKSVKPMTDMAYRGLRREQEEVIKFLKIISVTFEMCACNETYAIFRT